MDEFEEKYQKAQLELESKDLIVGGNWFLDAINFPFFYLQRRIQLRQIYYATAFEQWLRGSCFVICFFLLSAVLQTSGGAELDIMSRLAGYGVAAGIISTFGTIVIRWQAKRKKLTRWEDL